MRIALAGPIDLQLLQPALTSTVTSRGYAHPVTSHLALALVGCGHDVRVVALDQATREPYHLTGPSLQVTVLPLRPRARDRALDAFRVERRLLTHALREAEPDVVHAHWSYEFALAARRSGLPTLVTVHDWAPAILAEHRDIYRTIRLGMQIRSLRAATHLTAVSPYLQHKVTSRYHKPCSLVPNGLPDAYYEVTGPGRDDDVVRFGCLVAGDDPVKNLSAALEAFALVQRGDRTGVRLELAGGGCAPGERLHLWAQERGLDDGVEFRGRLEASDVPAYLAGLDVFVHPAREEAFGMAVVEAMAARLPVVGGRHSGAVPWLLEDGRAGVLTDVTRPAVLAESMRTLLDADTRARLSTRARDRAEEFRIAAVAESYVRQYERVVG